MRSRGQGVCTHLPPQIRFCQARTQTQDPVARHDWSGGGECIRQGSPRSADPGHRIARTDGPSCRESAFPSTGRCPTSPCKSSSARHEPVQRILPLGTTGRGGGACALGADELLIVGGAGGVREGQVFGKMQRMRRADQGRKGDRKELQGQVGPQVLLRHGRGGPPVTPARPRRPKARGAFGSFGSPGSRAAGAAAAAAASTSPARKGRAPGDLRGPRRARAPARAGPPAAPDARG